MKTEYLGQLKVKDIKDSSSELEDQRQTQDKTIKELTLNVQKAAQCYKQYIKNYKHVAMEIHCLAKDQQHSLMD